jgi:hypothetical protein
MSALRSRLLLACAATIVAAALGTAAAPALTVRAAPQRVTPAGVGAVKLGTTYTRLRAAGLVGTIGPGCELSGPQARSAKLRAPLTGVVDFTRTTPRKAATIVVTRGAAARGVGIGASPAKLRRAFPKATFDHGTDNTFGLTVASVPKGGGGRLQFAIDTKTHKVVQIGVPSLAFCD